MNAANSGIGMTSQRTRMRMVERLRSEGISDEVILAAMGEVPRHIFVDEALASRAYEDMALPLGFGQTISSPYTVARMLELLRSGGSKLDKVLEIGLMTERIVGRRLRSESIRNGRIPRSLTGKG